jgi:hypothetical protein
MNRRSALTLLAIAPLAFVAACGDDSDDAGATPATDAPPASTLPPVADGYEHPTGADEVVLRIAYEGGFVPEEVAFLDLPTVLVTADRSIQQGPVIEIYPGPLLPNMQERTIAEDGIQELLALADEAGLLQDREYASPDNIADAPDTVVTINALGETFVHRAYALGLAAGTDGGETDPDRMALAGFVADAQALVSGPESDVLGPEAPYDADVYLLRSFPVDDTSGYEVEPTLVDWPADAGVALADAAECATLPADVAVPLFADATQLTFFVDGGVTYRVAVTPQLPDSSC